MEIVLAPGVGLRAEMMDAGELHGLKRAVSARASGIDRRSGRLEEARAALFECWTHRSAAPARGLPT